MRLRAVLFDAVGTLFRVRGSVGAVYAAVAGRHGVTAAPDEIARRFADGFRDMPPLCFPATPASEIEERERAWWRQVVATTFQGNTFADFEAFFRDLFEFFATAEAWELYPETLALLDELRHRGLRIAVVSNFDSRLLKVCEGLHLTQRVDCVVMSSQAGFAKPDPRVFHHALARLGVQPDEALHAGDSVAEDIGGAQAAGLAAVLVGRDAQEPPSPGRVTDLRQILERVTVP